MCIIYSHIYPIIFRHLKKSFAIKEHLKISWYSLKCALISWCLGYYLKRVLFLKYFLFPAVTMASSGLWTSPSTWPVWEETAFTAWTESAGRESSPSTLQNIALSWPWSTANMMRSVWAASYFMYGILAFNGVLKSLEYLFREGFFSL